MHASFRGGFTKRDPAFYVTYSRVVGLTHSAEKPVWGVFLDSSGFVLSGIDTLEFS